MTYRTYRFIRKILEIHVFENGRLAGLFTRRYVISVAILLLALFVTTTNLHASTDAYQKQDIGGDKSLLASLTSDQLDDEDQLVEEGVDTNSDTVQDVSYLDGQALSAQDYYGGGTNAALPPTDEDTAVNDQADASSYLNAISCEPESASQQEHPPTRTTVVEYTVQDGDTIETIADKFGLKNSTILVANGLGSRGLIKPGQTLRILPVDGVVYKTKKGDTLSKIAKIYKSDTDKIMEFNSLADASSLAPGTELILPDGRLPPPPPSWSAPPGPLPHASQYLNTFRDVYVPPTAFAGLGSGSLLWPCGSRRITQYFKGARHTGLDIGAPKGTPIYAAEDGTVIYAGWNSGGYGNMTLIDHGGGLFTRYGHASKLLTVVGQQVKKGDIIALVGSTGRSTGPHLHFEVMKGTIHNRLNPLDYIR